MKSIPAQKKGLSRIRAAFFYSLSGLRYAFSAEAAFRQEIFMVIIATASLFFLPLSLMWKATLFLATASILVVELLNSAIEAVVDLAAPDYHPLAKHAKDLGSASILVSFSIAISLWTIAIFTLISQ